MWGPCLRTRDLRMLISFTEEKEEGAYPMASITVKVGRKSSAET